MKPGYKLNITLPDLPPQAAFALVCWLECFTHEVSLFYSDEVRSERSKRVRWLHRASCGSDKADIHFTLPGIPGTGSI